MSFLAIPPGRNNRGCSSRHSIIVELEANLAAPAIEDQVNFAGKVPRHVSGGDRAHPARAIGRRRRQWPPRRRNDRKRDRMSRHPQGDVLLARAGGGADRRAGRERDHKRQRPRPECFGKPKGIARKNALLKRCFKARNMGDERIELWPSLRRINSGDGFVRCRVGGQAVNGLGWDRDETAAAQGARRLGNPGRIRHRFLLRGPVISSKIAHHTWVVIPDDSKATMGLYFSCWSFAG